MPGALHERAFNVQKISGSCRRKRWTSFNIFFNGVFSCRFLVTTRDHTSVETFRIGIILKLLSIYLFGFRIPCLKTSWKGSKNRLKNTLRYSEVLIYIVKLKIGFIKAQALVFYQFRNWLNALLIR